MFDKDHIQSLAAAVTKWVQYSTDPSPQVMDIIKAFTPAFKYTGQMYRTVFLFDKGDLPDELEPYLIQHEHGSRVASWAKSLDGMYKWLSKTGEDFHFEDDDDAMHEVLCTQTGNAFDIELFHSYLTEHYPEMANFSTERGAGVHEVIAPYYAASLRAEIEQTYENTRWFDDEEEDEDD